MKLNCTRLPNQMNTTEFMLRWISQQGFPVLTAYTKEHNLTVYQNVFQMSKTKLKPSPYKCALR